MPLADLTSLFGLTLSEDAATGGLLVTSRGPVIILTAGQSLVSVGGRIVALSGSVMRDGRNWYVPIDFLPRVLSPALNVRIEVRRSTRVIVVGDVRVPQVSIRLDRQGGNGAMQFDVQPGVAHRVTHEGGRLTIRFEADALDVTPITGNLPDFVAGVRIASQTLDSFSRLVAVGVVTLIASISQLTCCRLARWFQRRRFNLRPKRQ